MKDSKGGLVTFEWRLDSEADEASVQQFAREVQQRGGEAHVQPAPKGFLPLAIPAVIFGAVKVAGLVEQVADWWKNRKRSGVLIHVASNGKIDIQPLGIPYGQVLFVGKDGKTLQYTNVSQDKMKDLLSAAAQGIVPSGGSAPA